MLHNNDEIQQNDTGKNDLRCILQNKVLANDCFHQRCHFKQKKIGKEGEISPNTCIMFISETPGLEIISGMSIKLCEKG